MKKWVSPKPKHFPMRDLSKLMRLTLIERNTLRESKVRIYKRNDIYADFIADYIKGLIESACTAEKGIKLYHGQVIKIRKFISSNGASWDLKYGINDCAIEMEHGLPYVEVIFNEQQRLQAALRINGKKIKRPYNSRFRKRNLASHQGNSEG
jgi:hypothetical protein